MRNDWKSEFDKKFREVGSVGKLTWQEESVYGCDELINDDIKDFIAQQIASTIQQCVLVLELIKQEAVNEQRKLIEETERIKGIYQRNPDSIKAKDRAIRDENSQPKNVAFGITSGKMIAVDEAITKIKELGE